MRGDGREWQYPVLKTEEETNNKDEADLLAKTFIKIYSSNNLSEEAKKGKKQKNIYRH